MIDDCVTRPPVVLNALLSDAEKLGFNSSSEPRTGALLQVLAASKPGGRLLELGTGIGVATAWIAAGMNEGATLDTVERDEAVAAVARDRLSDDRVRFHVADAAAWLTDYRGSPFDLIFADASPGKFFAREAALELLAIGGFYIIDDLATIPNRDEERRQRTESLITELEHTAGLACLRVGWSSGLLIAVKC